MTETRSISATLQYLNRTLRADEAATLPDSELVGRFVERRDEAAYNAWLADMGSHFDLTGEQSYRVRLNAPKEPDRFGRYMVFEFHPKENGIATTETAGRAATPAGTR